LILFERRSMRLAKAQEACSDTGLGTDLVMRLIMTMTRLHKNSVCWSSGLFCA
jgi:hypothetical protein